MIYTGFLIFTMRLKDAQFSLSGDRVDADGLTLQTANVDVDAVVLDWHFRAQWIYLLPVHKSQRECILSSGVEVRMGGGMEEQHCLACGRIGNHDGPIAIQEARRARCRQSCTSSARMKGNIMYNGCRERERERNALEVSFWKVKWHPGSHQTSMVVSVYGPVQTKSVGLCIVKSNCTIVPNTLLGT